MRHAVETKNKKTVLPFECPFTSDNAHLTEFIRSRVYTLWACASVCQTIVFLPEEILHGSALAVNPKLLADSGGGSGAYGVPTWRNPPNERRRWWWGEGIAVLFGKFPDYVYARTGRHINFVRENQIFDRSASAFGSNTDVAGHRNSAKSKTRRVLAGRSVDGFSLAGRTGPIDRNNGGGYSAIVIAAAHPVTIYVVGLHEQHSCFSESRRTVCVKSVLRDLGIVVPRSCHVTCPYDIEPCWIFRSRKLGRIESMCVCNFSQSQLNMKTVTHIIIYLWCIIITSDW